MWAFGVLLYEIWTKAETPYKGMNNQKVWVEVTNGYRLPCPAGCEQEIHARMLSCWKEDPHHRATFRSLCMYFRQRSFALGTIPAYELPEVFEAPSDRRSGSKAGVTKKSSKIAVVDASSKKASSAVKEGIKNAKKKEKRKKSMVSVAPQPHHYSEGVPQIVTSAHGGPSHYFDLTGKVKTEMCG